MIAPTAHKPTTSDVGYRRVSAVERDLERSVAQKDFVSRAIGNYPVVALVTATAIGVSLGWFVKRHLK
ncbi:hypothetical protein FYK55_13955 [Roseiconus nitratireducens]|uniref:Uncharacterized protein n=1 Tax=Roseiconus nitratireducens TaxID=2605748 RepID=A0A5M6D562_9BACT|nr:hypothetical protein [Roseiconus nitratireducens]KAA5542634.1 hypothetical protein FYK55_13955 [Roseiconus nitratireducens]